MNPSVSQHRGPKPVEQIGVPSAFSSGCPQVGGTGRGGLTPAFPSSQRQHFSMRNLSMYPTSYVRRFSSWRSRMPRPPSTPPRGVAAQSAARAEWEAASRRDAVLGRMRTSMLCSRQQHAPRREERQPRRVWSALCRWSRCGPRGTAPTPRILRLRIPYHPLGSFVCRPGRHTVGTKQAAGCSIQLGAARGLRAGRAVD